MNNQRSSSEQIILFLLLAFAAWTISNQFFGSKNSSTGPARTAPALSEAFARIDPQNPANSKPFTRAEAEKERNALVQKIDANKEDALAYWSRLRVGLLEQYILNPKDPKAATKYYDEITYHAGNDAVEAQAYYQKGNLLWERAKAPGATTEDQSRLKEGVDALYQLLHRGRGESYASLQIYVPKELATTIENKGVQPTGAGVNGTQATTSAYVTIPGTPIPAQGFTAVKISSIRNGPNSLLARVNDYYSTTSYYKVFDTVVQWFGNQPTYSYGLAIIFFATLTRILVQPLNKKQYDSMKGMAVIAPEMKKIQEKYKGKADQQAQVQMYKEIQALQKNHGVSPMMGCGLALVQMPIFFLFVSPLIQHYEPKFELVGASFLWVHNLAQPDIPLLILYGISMFVSVRLSSVPPTDDMQRQQQMLISFVMPLMLPFFLLGWASAFTMYWMIYNVVSTVFQYRMMKAADPTKSVVKSLLSVPTAPPPVIDDSVPPRPKSESSRSERKDPRPPASNTTKAANKVSKTELSTSSNGATNGTSNGIVAHDNGLNGALSTAANGSAGDAMDDGDGDEVVISKTEKGAGGESQNRKNNNSQRARRRRRY